MQDAVSFRNACRVCGKADLTPIFSLGDLYISDFLGEDEQAQSLKAPLELVLCDTEKGGCGLLQLRHTVSHETMYRNYWYRSGVNKTMMEALADITRKVESLTSVGRDDFVLDIGANDGTLLRAYRTEGLNRIGFEPARNLKSYNQEGATKIINDFFNYEAWAKEFPGEKAKAITAIAMFYDLEEPNRFLKDIVKILDDNGVFIIQMSYLPLMLAMNELGNICHEHIEYYSLFSLENLLKRHKLEVVDVELNDVNGGSFRVYIRHRGKGERLCLPVEAGTRVAMMRAYEKALGLGTKKVYEDFVARVDRIREDLLAFIRKELVRGKKIYIYGASTKGNTVLQYFGIDDKMIVAAAERNPDKWGKKTVGTNIPIISEDEARKAHPDYFLVLPWHFLREFRAREQKFFERGGKFIVPFPELGIVEH